MTVLFLIMVSLVAYVIYLYFVSEGFQAGMPGIRCGVDLPRCGRGTECMNGFCSSPDQPILIKNQLPVYP
jgi:hypothetical protein